MTTILRSPNVIGLSAPRRARSCTPATDGSHSVSSNAARDLHPAQRPGSRSENPRRKSDAEAPPPAAASFAAQRYWQAGRLASAERAPVQPLPAAGSASPLSARSGMRTKVRTRDRVNIVAPPCRPSAQWNNATCSRRGTRCGSRRFAVASAAGRMRRSQEHTPSPQRRVAPRAHAARPNSPDPPDVAETQCAGNRHFQRWRHGFLDAER